MTERELYDSYRLDVYRTAFFMLRKKEDAEDILQDVFIKAFQKDFPSIESKKAWLLRITMNECRNYLKRKSRIFFLQDLKKETTSEEVAVSVETIIVDNEAKQDVIQIISILKPILKEVMILKYLHDLKNEEIATILDIPLGTVKSRANKGLKLLKEHIEKKNSSLVSREVAE